MTAMVTALALERSDGQFEQFITEGRTIRSIDGLTGLATREAVDARPSGHGSLNRSKYRDAPPIELVGELFGSDAAGAWTQWDAIAAVCASAVAEDRELRWTTASALGLRVSDARLVSLSAPVEVYRDVLRYQLVLRRDDPRAYSQTTRTITGGTLSASGGGAVFPAEFPVVFTPAGGGDAAFTVGGTDSTPPVLRVYGYCTAPTLRLVSTGEEIVLLGEIEADTYVEVDVAAGQVRLEDGTVRNNLLDYANSTLFELPPGPQTVQMLASNFDSVARVDVIFADAYA